MEKHRKFTIVVTPDGNFQKVKPIKDVELGAEVSYEAIADKGSGLLFFKSKKSTSFPVRYIAIACMLLLFVMPFYFLGGQTKAYAYVNLDINPSLEMEIDKDLNVVSVAPLNDDAKKLLRQLTDYEDKKIEQFIEMIMNKSAELGFTKNGKNVLIGVSYINGETVSVLNSVDNYFSTNMTAWDIATFQVPKDLREQALENNISMNRIMAKTIIETNSGVEKINNQPHTNDDEKELIQSFYLNSTVNHQSVSEDDLNSSNQDVSNSSVSIPKPGNEKSAKHPSELKGKNGELHSNGKNKHNKSDKIDHKNKTDKVKGNNKHKKEKDKNKHDKQKKNKDNKKNKKKNKHEKHNNGKHKEKHKK